MLRWVLRSAGRHYRTAQGCSAAGCAVRSASATSNALAETCRKKGAKSSAPEKFMKDDTIWAIHKADDGVSTTPMLHCAAQRRNKKLLSLLPSSLQRSPLPRSSLLRDAHEIVPYKRLSSFLCYLQRAFFVNTATGQSTWDVSEASWRS